MKPIGPLYLIDLLPIIDEKLITLLNGLSVQDWERPTIAGNWTVKDVAAHLLDGNLRTLSMLRDGYSGEKPGQLENYQDLVDWLNGLNSDWVKAMRRISPRILVALLELSGEEYHKLLRRLPPHDKAPFAVAWAGETESANWFHIAREYTEKWHHQQQIRLAVGQEKILYHRAFYHPYLDTSMRALPYHYRSVKAGKGTIIHFRVTGAGGGDWWLHRAAADDWQLITDAPTYAPCTVTIPGHIAWRIFTKGISRSEARVQSTIDGDIELGEPVFEMLAVMA